MVIISYVPPVLVKIGEIKKRGKLETKLPLMTINRDYDKFDPGQRSYL